MTDGGESAETTRSSSSKIDRVASRYDLEGLGADLEARWLGVDGDQESTRALADYVNESVLAAALEQHDAYTLSGDVGELYAALTDDEHADATLVRSRLERTGVDVDAVTDDFVSHQTVYRYLTAHREVERPAPSDAERTAKAIETIQKLRGRTTAVTEQSIERLRESDVVAAGEFSVLNDVQVLCEECGRSADVAEFLEQGGCECQME